jgi:membrane-bound metal-dependent hydrolase YbcI (DUF457 family)
MLGRTHVLSGMAAFNAVTLIPLLDLHPSLTARAAGTVLAGGAAALCDLDSCGATASRCFGFASEGVAACIGWVSRGHREGTHSAVGITAFTGYTAVTLAVLTTPHALPYVPAWGIRDAAGVLLAGILMFCVASLLEALHWAGQHTADLIALAAAAAVVIGHARIPGLAGLPVAVFIGIATHITGDCLTEHGCPLLWPWSERRFHIVPRWAQFSTGTWPEHVIAWGLVAANLWFAWSLTGLAAYTAHP